MAVFDVNIAEISKILFDEASSLIGRERSMGTYNMAGIIFGLIIGSVTIAAIEFEKVLRILVQIFGREQVRVFEKSASFETMFYVLVIFLFVSIVAILLDKWRRR